MRNAFRKCHVHLFGIFRKHIRFLPKALLATITPKPYRKVCPIFTKHLYCMAFWLSMAKVYRHHILLQAFSISVCYIYLRKVIHHKLSTPGYYMTACWCSKKSKSSFHAKVIQVTFDISHIFIHTFYSVVHSHNY